MGAWLYVLLSTPAGLWAALALDPYVVPVVNALLIFPVFYRHLRRQAHRRNFCLMLFWAVCLSLSATLATFYLPAWTADRILWGPTYAREMFVWIETGMGAEGDYRQFVPQHLAHAALFAALTSASGGLLGLLMGSILLNYMSFYVGTLLVASHAHLFALLFGWPVWAVLRVMGFVALAIPLSELFYRMLRRWPSSGRVAWQFAVAGVALLLLDMFLKFGLHEHWRQRLSIALSSR
ncbi:MAG: hypothetical protein HY652_01335 [Acidobacteria bacterium]|nr:hypothetical protein [Acidobacteriota bacterium]